MAWLLWQLVPPRQALSVSLPALGFKRRGRGLCTWRMCGASFPLHSPCHTVLAQLSRARSLPLGRHLNLSTSAGTGVETNGHLG